MVLKRIFVDVYEYIAWISTGNFQAFEIDFSTILQLPLAHGFATNFHKSRCGEAMLSFVSLVIVATAKVERYGDERYQTRDSVT